METPVVFVPHPPAPQRTCRDYLKMRRTAVTVCLFLALAITAAVVKANRSRSPSRSGSSSCSTARGSTHSSKSTGDTDDNEIYGPHQGFQHLPNRCEIEAYRIPRSQRQRFRYTCHEGAKYVITHIPSGTRLILTAGASDLFHACIFTSFWRVVRDWRLVLPQNVLSMHEHEMLHGLNDLAMCEYPFRTVKLLCRQ